MPSRQFRKAQTVHAARCYGKDRFAPDMLPGLADQEDWRRKYYDAVKAVEQEGRQNRDQREVLYRLVGRLCVVAQGQDAHLDSTLQSLRDATRRMAPFEEIEPLGRMLGEVVVDIDRRRNARPEHAGATVALEASLRAVLSQLLEELAREPQLADAAKAIESELDESLPEERRLQLVEKVSALVLQRIGELENSRRELESLMGQMLDRLDSLSRYIAGQGADETARNASAATLNTQITGEMQAIGESVAGAAELSQIREQLRARLDAISQHLHLFRLREEERARQAIARTESLRERMDKMESEARRLQARLCSEKRLLLLDPLTRIGNRLAWDQRYTAECDRWRRFRQPTCLLAWDIDHFKAINDSYGHRAGDKVLSVVAESLSKNIRGSDFVARYGGEEFVMLLPGTSLEDGVRLANRMRENIAQIGFHFRGKPVWVTISCGVTELREGDADNEAFDRADKAMYRAKQGGRNRVVSA